LIGWNCWSKAQGLWDDEATGKCAASLSEVRRSKISVITGTGDKGETSLFSGERVPKNMARVEAGGDVDELNSLIGMLVAAVTEEAEEVKKELRRIQSDLFHLGARLATTPGSPQAALLSDVGDGSIRALEEAIGRMEKALPPLAGFIMPGGHPSAAWAHVARTVCRRAERRAVNLVFDSDRRGADERLGQSIRYLNRLSDYLFVLARYLNHKAGAEEILWKK
jgi:cob(I)alamin adenosyltransferase